MTVYYTQMTSTQFGGAFVSFSLKPVTYAIQILRAEYTFNSQGDVRRYTSSTVSGGSSVTSIPMRDGAQPASATVRAGSLTISGTSVNFSSTNSIASPWTPISTLIIAPGDVFAFVGTNINMTSAGIYFEELHLARST